MLLTIPVGQDAIVVPLHRIYGSRRLPLLLNGFDIEAKDYWSKDGQNRWIPVDEEKALGQKLRPNCYALGCYVLRVSESAQETGEVKC